MTGPTYTDRTLPAPWQECDFCGKVAGLPNTGSDYALCAACSRLNLLHEAARESLEALAAPILGAWVSQWTAAGVPLEDLEVTTQHFSGAGLNERAGRAHRLAHLRYLRREYGPPVFEVQRPDRHELSAIGMPALTACREANPARGERSGYFLDSEGNAHRLFPGLDVLTVILPDGDALLIYTGIFGQTDFTSKPDFPGQQGFRVPAALLPQVRAALAGEA